MELTKKHSIKYRFRPTSSGASRKTHKTLKLSKLQKNLGFEFLGLKTVECRYELEKFELKSKLKGEIFFKKSYSYTNVLVKQKTSNRVDLL